MILLVPILLIVYSVWGNVYWLLEMCFNGIILDYKQNINFVYFTKLAVFIATNNTS